MKIYFEGIGILESEVCMTSSFNVVKPIIESFLSKYNVIDDRGSYNCLVISDKLQMSYNLTSLEIMFCCDFLLDRLELSRELIKKDMVNDFLVDEEIMQLLFLFVAVLVGISTDRIKLVDFNIYELERKQNYADFVYNVMKCVDEVNIPFILEMLGKFKDEVENVNLIGMIDRLISDISGNNFKLEKNIKDCSNGSYLGLRKVFWGQVLFNFSKIDADILTIWDSSENVVVGLDIDGNTNSVSLKHEELILCIDDLRIGFLMFDNAEILFSIFLLVDQEERKYRAVLYDDNIYRHGYSSYKYYQFGLKLPLRDYINDCFGKIDFDYDYCTLEELKKVLLFIIKKSRKENKKKNKKKKKVVVGVKKGYG